MSVTPDPGKLARPIIVSRILRGRMRDVRRKLALRLGITRLADVSADDLLEPDSELAFRARELAAKLSPPFLMNHVMRTWCFAAAFAARREQKIDRELLYLAAVLHDLGLVEAYADEPGSFEWVGARHARELCVAGGLSAERAELLEEAIALHSSMGIADLREPEIALLHFGAGCDLFGLRLDELPPSELEHTLERFPRLGFKNAFGNCLTRQATIKPESHIAGPVGMGVMARLHAAPFAD